MPFASVKQRRFMYSQHPDIAKRWESETPAGPLPETAPGPEKKRKKPATAELLRQISKPRGR